MTSTTQRLLTVSDIVPEKFADAAYTEIQNAPYWTPGICFNPACSRPFTPTRPWQIHCCKSCKAATDAEMRRFGDLLALPMLVHRMGKYERDDPAILDRTRAARRFATQVQSQWWSSRQTRAEHAQASNQEVTS